jgi:signal transduction histidine kinase
MSIGVHAPPVGALRATLLPQSVRSSNFVAAVMCGALVALPFLRPAHSVNPGARAALETTITLSAVLSGGLFLAICLHGRRLHDLLLLCALVAIALTDFIYSAAPALSGGVGLESRGDARLAFDVIVALAFAAAALAPGHSPPRRSRGIVGLSFVVGAGAVALVELFEQVTGSHWPGGTLIETVRGHAAGHPEALTHPVALTLHIAAAAVLLVSTLAFLRRPGRAGPESRLLAGASYMLALAQLEYLTMPAVATNWVTPREGLRLGAYALLLAVAGQRFAREWRSKTRAVITSERERIARDLHDGLIQDLACIAMQGQRLDSGLGPEHPLIVAARRALDASRGTIADLTASTAPTTEAALRIIAAELEHRFDLVVDVRVDASVPPTPEDDLDPSRREHLIRIAREAIVNAALHGMARHVTVILTATGRGGLLMRISDDGRGIGDSQRPGFGLRTMRARAAALGGELSTGRTSDGGTALELLVP